MVMVPLPYNSCWAPFPIGGLKGPQGHPPGNGQLDANGEEFQQHGHLHIPGGGSKTFGPSAPCAIGWLVSTSATFPVDAVLRVGLKGPGTIDYGTGPPVRATLGAGAFNVYRDLVAGTDALTVNTWREDVMNGGSPLTLTHGDRIAITWLLTHTIGAPVIRVGASTYSYTSLPTATLVTAGPTYTQSGCISNAILTFSDGTQGWIEFSFVHTGTGEANTAAIAVNNIKGNIVSFPFSCQIDAVHLSSPAVNATSNYAVNVYSTPFGTPTLLSQIVMDPNTQGGLGSGNLFLPFLTPVTLAANTEYCIGIQALAGSGCTLFQYDVQNAAHFLPNGLGTGHYAVDSVGGATFVVQNGGRRRYGMDFRLSAIDIPAAGGGLHLVGAGGLAG